ncbi:MAG: DUF3043 domain-containing protein [SAR202 cluster bacterium]|jgi:hypothetical protein|nr:DUF3043 domain-containing protein [SAR202 cluster bacterium]|tara:strand:- start:8721 stop:9248 length:528 start_codon:yes stop_codon:yes gene_type:complete
MSNEMDKKGKATPKRKDAVAKNKVNSITSPVSKADRSKNRQALRAARVGARAAYMRGEESALPARDRGPVKRFVRDYIDSHRSLGEYFLPLMIAILVLTLIPSVEIRFFAIILMYSVMGYSAIYGIFVGRKIKKIVSEKFPGESTKGLGFYGWLRSTQMRRLRAPAPQKKLGESI